MFSIVKTETREKKIDKEMTTLFFFSPRGGSIFPMGLRENYNFLGSIIQQFKCITLEYINLHIER